MIVRISFTGITKNDKHKSTLEDYIEIHIGGVKEAKEAFSTWTRGCGIRGASGIFHPLNGYGDVKIKAITEVTKTGDLVISEEKENADSEELLEDAKPKTPPKGKSSAEKEK